MPIIGLGVYQNPNCKPACLAALQCGYRSVSSVIPISSHNSVVQLPGISTRHVHTGTKPKSEMLSGKVEYPARTFSSVCVAHSGEGPVNDVAA